MVTINKTAMQPYLQKAMLLGRHSLVLGLAVAKQFVAWLKTPAVQRTAFRNIALMIAGYLLMLCLFFLYSLSLNTPEILPAPVAQQLQQQDVDLDALNEAVTRLEKKGIGQTLILSLLLPILLAAAHQQSGANDLSLKALR